MRLYVCDKCGEKLGYNYTEATLTRVTFKLFEQCEPKKSSQIDLCPKCWEKLGGWLYNREDF